MRRNKDHLCKTTQLWEMVHLPKERTITFENNFKHKLTDLSHTSLLSTGKK